jgi:hypothetical protein
MALPLSGGNAFGIKKAFDCVPDGTASLAKDVLVINR